MASICASFFRREGAKGLAGIRLQRGPQLAQQRDRGQPRPDLRGRRGYLRERDHISSRRQAVEWGDFQMVRIKYYMH